MPDTNDSHTILKHGKECGSLHLIYDFLKKFQCFFFKKEYFTASGLSYVLLGLFFFFFLRFLYFIFWLCWVFLAACWPSLVVASRGYSSLPFVGFSLRWLLVLQSWGSRVCGLQ